MSDDNFLSRWSRRKHQVRRGDEVEEIAKPTAPAVEPPVPPVPRDTAEAPVETPPVESLTPESDFTPFMNPKVDRGLRNQALKTLFSDPRYNIMDGLDVYIDDYSKPDPLPEGWLEKMTQVARLGDYQPPKEEEAGLAPAPVADPVIAEAGASTHEGGAEPQKPAEGADAVPSDTPPQDAS
jgi:hypothetical protein